MLKEQDNQYHKMWNKAHTSNKYLDLYKTAQKMIIFGACFNLNIMVFYQGWRTIL